MEADGEQCIKSIPVFICITNNYNCKSQINTITYRLISVVIVELNLNIILCLRHTNDGHNVEMIIINILPIFNVRYLCFKEYYFMCRYL